MNDKELEEARKAWIKEEVARMKTKLPNEPTKLKSKLKSSTSSENKDDTLVQFSHLKDLLSTQIQPLLKQANEDVKRLGKNLSQFSGPSSKHPITIQDHSRADASVSSSSSAVSFSVDQSSEFLEGKSEILHYALTKMDELRRKEEELRLRLENEFSMMDLSDTKKVQEKSILEQQVEELERDIASILNGSDVIHMSRSASQNFSDASEPVGYNDEDDLIVISNDAKKPVCKPAITILESGPMDDSELMEPIRPNSDNRFEAIQERVVKRKNLFISKTLVEGVQDYRSLFMKFVNEALGEDEDFDDGQFAQGDLRPWDVIERVADEFMEEILNEVTEEMKGFTDEYVGEIFRNEMDS